jgi:hypothetical protein
MKFLFTRLVSGSLLGIGPRIVDGMTPENARLLMAVYSAGFVAVFGTFVLLYWNAWRQRDRLRREALVATLAQ